MMPWPQYSPSVTHRPRELPTGGLAALWGWVGAALATTDEEMLASCGLDALVRCSAVDWVVGAAGGKVDG